MNLVKALVLGFAASSLLAMGCGVPQEQYDADMKRLQDTQAQLQTQLDKANQDLAAVRGEKDGLSERLSALNGELGTLREESDKRAKALEAARKRQEDYKKMVEKFRSMVESGKLKVKIQNNKMLVELASAILFPSGQAKLSKEGDDALTEVAAVLSTITDRQFQVAGHTDDIPIKNARFKSNWELSSARAVAVVKKLAEAGVKEANLSAAGYADTQPASPNDSEEGRAVNRRIEIVLQPNLEELPDLSALESAT
jgi:chemotaxis protein MotB